MSGLKLVVEFTSYYWSLIDSNKDISYSRFEYQNKYNLISNHCKINTEIVTAILILNLLLLGTKIKSKLHFDIDLTVLWYQFTLYFGTASSIENS